MKKWYFTASIDAVDIDYQTVIYAKYEPDFWRLYDLAKRHGCEFWTLEDEDYEEIIF